MELAGQASQQWGAAKLLIDFCISVGADLQWTTLVHAYIKVGLVPLVDT